MTHHRQAPEATTLLKLSSVLLLAAACGETASPAGDAVAASGAGAAGASQTMPTAGTTSAVLNAGGGAGMGGGTAGTAGGPLADNSAGADGQNSADAGNDGAGDPTNAGAPPLDESGAAAAGQTVVGDTAGTGGLPNMADMGGRANSAGDAPLAAGAGNSEPAGGANNGGAAGADMGPADTAGADMGGAGMAGAAGAAGMDEPGEEWIQLFNGVDLQGWIPKFAGSEVGVNYKNTFRVVDGLLVVNYDEYDGWNGEFGHLFYDEVFSHYIIRAEYRFVGEQVAGGVDWGWLNNGIMIHSQSPQSMALAQQFPISIEVKLFAQPGSISGNVCTPGTDVKLNGVYTDQRHCMDTTTFSHGANEWVTIEAEVRGHESIIHRSNGIVTAEYTEPIIDPNDPNEERRYAQQLLDAGANRLISEGYISIQSETHPTEFRKIEIKLLDPAE